MSKTRAILGDLTLSYLQCLLRIEKLSCIGHFNWVTLDCINIVSLLDQSALLPDKTPRHSLISGNVVPLHACPKYVSSCNTLYQSLSMQSYAVYRGKRVNLFCRKGSYSKTLVALICVANYYQPIIHHHFVNSVKSSFKEYKTLNNR